jgi:streptomycin 3"-adenylyltransferase
MTADEQLQALAAGLQSAFGDALTGAYVHGSKVLGCFGPVSDLDVLAVLSRPGSAAEKEHLAKLCLALSGDYSGRGPHFAFELDVVVGPALQPWRYPPPFDFHYSETWRDAFQDGNLEPWPRRANPDLAAHIWIARRTAEVLAGKPPAEALPEVPWSSYREALLDDVDRALEHRWGKESYAVLGLARVWATLTTFDVHSKVTGAEWALPRLPPELRLTLEHGLAVYRGEQPDQSWQGLPVDGYLDFVVTRIRASRRAVRRPRPGLRGLPR